MAKNDNLKDFITDIADAIRQKKGSTELINPQDFSNEIINIQSSTGGSSSGGSEASTVEYLQFESTLDAGVFMEQAGIAVIDAVVSVTSQGISITQAAPINVMLLMKEQADEFSMTKLSADWNRYIVIKTPDGNIFKGKAIDYILSSGITQEQLDAIPRITKEEFYNISE